jgi:hypothetical protein
LLTFNGSTSFGLKMLKIIKAAMRALVIEFIFECKCTLWKNLQRYCNVFLLIGGKVFTRSWISSIRANFLLTGAV